MSVSPHHRIRFPSGASVVSLKKDARKRVKTTPGLTHIEALNQLARENGLAMPWDQAVTTLACGKEAEVCRKKPLASRPGPHVPAFLIQAVEARADTINVRAKSGDLGEVWVHVNGEWNKLTTISRGEAADFGATCFKTMVPKPCEEYSTDQSFMGRVTDPAWLTAGVLSMRVTQSHSINAFILVIRMRYEESQSEIPRKVSDLASLGFLPGHLRLFRGAFQKLNGLFLVGGVMGSGKDTTTKFLIEALLSQWPIKQRPAIGIYTGEKGLDVPIHGIREFLDKDGKDQRDVMNTIMTTDVTFLGEIRNPFHAYAAIEGVQTGGTVFATVHAFSPETMLKHLHQMASYVTTRVNKRGKPIGPKFDATPYLKALADGGNLTLCTQELAPALCHDCRQPLADNQSADARKIKAVLRSFKIRISGTYHRGPGCAKCREGIAGRTMIASVIRPDEHYVDLVLAGKLDAASQYAEKTGIGVNGFTHRIEAGEVDPMREWIRYRRYA